MWQTKYASAVPKNFGLGFDFRPCSEGNFFTGHPQSVCIQIKKMPRVCKISKKTEEHLLKENLEGCEWVSIKSQELPVRKRFKVTSKIQNIQTSQIDFPRNQIQYLFISTKRDLKSKYRIFCRLFEMPFKNLCETCWRSLFYEQFLCCVSLFWISTAYLEVAKNFKRE